MADQNPDDSLSDRSLDNSQACSPASTSQPVNEHEIATTLSSSFGGGTDSSLQLNENFIGQRVMNQQHQGRTTQSQSRSRDLAYAAQQGLTEFTNANRVAEPHLRPASNMPTFVPGDIETIPADVLTPPVHGPNLTIDVIDPSAVLTGTQQPSAHAQQFHEVISSNRPTGPANSQMHFVPGQNISTALPVVVSRNPISPQRPLHGQSTSVVVPRDRRIPANMQRPPVSGQNLSSVVLKDTDKTLIDEQGCNHPGESSSNAVPQDTRKRSISETKPSAHGQGLFNPLPADTNAFARGSPVKSSIATKGQTSLQGDTKAFARGSIAKSSIATQGQTSLQGPFTPFAGRTNAFARGSVAKSSTATQAQTSSQGLFINSAGGTFARESVAKSPIATQGETSLQPQSKRSKINSEDRWNLAVGKGTKLESSMRYQPSATAENKSSPSLIPTPQEEPIHHIREEEFPLIGEKCQLCNIDMAFNPTGSALSSSHNNNILPISACFPCGHCYHYNCLKSIYGSPGKGEGPPCFRCSEDAASSDSP